MQGASAPGSPEQSEDERRPDRSRAPETSCQSPPFANRSPWRRVARYENTDTKAARGVQANRSRTLLGAHC
ncbi:hypothetical protein MRX96_004454 [Rhipicephalus microplus]